MKKLWTWFLARTRLSLRAVCEASRGKGIIDWHDIRDSVPGSMDGVCLICERCGKRYFA